MINHSLPKTAEELPPGIAARHLFKGHQRRITGIAWSPDGRQLASVSLDGTIRVWDVEAGTLRQNIEANPTSSVSWSPDGRTLAAGGTDGAVSLWDTDSWQPLRQLLGHSNDVFTLAWSRDGKALASGAVDSSVRVWHASTGEPLQELEGHLGWIKAVTWSPDGKLLASGSSFESTVRVWETAGWKLAHVFDQRSAEIAAQSPEAPAKGPDPIVLDLAFSPDGALLASGSGDNVVRLWNLRSGHLERIIEGHTDSVIAVAFSSNGTFLASMSRDGQVLLWPSASWERILGPKAPQSERWETGLAFNPQASTLGMVTERGIEIWDIDLPSSLASGFSRASIHYSNAKVVLVGESGTGKTCLGRALMEKPFEPQESTHGMRVWTFEVETVQPEATVIERETMLWDLAGQADYRVIHQLFLEETALAIVLCDLTHPENPFAGAGYWEKALQRATRRDIPKLLVAGRVDRGSPRATRKEIDSYLQTHRFLDYIPTSAKTGEGIAELREAIARAVPWERLPVISAPQLWRDIRQFLLKRRESANVLTLRSELREAFRREYPEAELTEEVFDTVLRQAQTQGLIWSFSYGDLVLMQPELLNNYASAVVRAARKHPEGLGCVGEAEVLGAEIDFEDLTRLSDLDSERNLLPAVVELFLASEVALRESGRLVFPSKFNRRRPEFPSLPLPEVIYWFAGSVEVIYATLIVRLAYSEVFELKDIYKDAVEFSTASGRICGFVIQDGEAEGELSIFIESAASIDSKVLFVRFIQQHLEHRSIRGSVKRQRVYRCPACGEEIEGRRAVDARLKQGRAFIHCQYCDTRIPLIDLMEERLGDPELLRQVREMEAEAAQRRAEEVAVTTAKAKGEIGEFDVLFSYSKEDQEEVQAIAKKMRRYGLNPWLEDPEESAESWRDAVESGRSRIKSAAVFVGSQGEEFQEPDLGPLLRRGRMVVPVILPSCRRKPKLSGFLRQLKWIDFRKSEPDPIGQLIWAVTGKPPASKAMK